LFGNETGLPFRVFHLPEDQPYKLQCRIYRETLLQLRFPSPYPYRFLNLIKIKQQKYAGNFVIVTSKVLLNSIHLV